MLGKRSKGSKTMQTVTETFYGARNWTRAGMWLQALLLLEGVIDNEDAGGRSRYAEVSERAAARFISLAK